MVASNAIAAKKKAQKPTTSRLGVRAVPGTPGSAPPGVLGAPPNGSGMSGPPEIPGGPAIHSESVVPDSDGKGFHTITIDAGNVKSIDGNKITITEGIKDEKYKDVELDLSDVKTVMRNHKIAKLSDIAVGDRLFVCISSDGDSMVNAVDVATQKRGGAGRPNFPPGPGGPGSPGGPPPMSLG